MQGRTYSGLDSLFVCLFVSEVTKCQDGLQFEARSIPYKMCQLHMMVNVAGINSTMVFVVTLGQTTTQPFLDLERTG